MKFSFRCLAYPALLFSLLGCVDAVTPVFQFETGFLLVEGRIADTPGYSEVRVARNAIRFEIYTLEPVADARVSSIDDLGEEVGWEREGDEETFRPPPDWAAVAGREYFIRVVTPTGEVIESEPEPVPTAVPLENPRITFEQEAYFSDGLNRFVPAFRLLVDIQDPAGEANFYQYRYTTYQTIEVCITCERSRYRNGECVADAGTRFIERYDYLCGSRCWHFATGTDINIFSDAFGDGRRLTGVEAGRVDYDRPGPLLFDVQQYAISRAAYDYNDVLRDLSAGAGGLNAPLPAALVGNLTDVSDRSTNVLGFVGVASVDTERLFIVRDTFGGTPLPYNPNIRLEPVFPSPPTAPCTGPDRTDVEPEGWQN